MIQVGARTHSEHILVIRYNIKRRLVEKSEDVENGAISGRILRLYTHWIQL
jgi:hypothetical protein